tara:strand:- start:20429 stop:20704 length:276 start_codon:yes stop_codon:yes gene_type:complete
MNMVLTIIAVLGLGALLISVVIFTMAARRYVSDDDHESLGLVSDSGRDYRPRNRDDRRQAPPPALFPITINGELIPEDRRQLPDRRQARSG